MSRQSTISREIDLERSQFYTILIISAGIYNEDTVRYFFMPGNIFFYKNIQQGTVQLGIGQPHVGSYIPSGIVETSNLPITIKHGFCNALSSGHGVAVWWCHGGHCFLLCIPGENSWKVGLSHRASPLTMLPGHSKPLLDHPRRNSGPWAQHFVVGLKATWLHKIWGVRGFNNPNWWKITISPN